MTIEYTYNLCLTCKSKDFLFAILRIIILIYKPNIQNLHSQNLFIVTCTGQGKCNFTNLILYIHTHLQHHLGYLFRSTNLKHGVISMLQRIQLICSSLNNWQSLLLPVKLTNCKDTICNYRFGL